MTLFELSAIGGPWARRLAPRRRLVFELPWNEVNACASLESRWAWTQSSFSEYASAAAFAEIASALLAAGAPIDLVAAAGDFVADEMVHAELSARVAMALGGAVELEVDLDRLVRPAANGARPLLRAAELVVRTSCVGEALTVPLLKRAHRDASGVIAAVIARIARDESAHAELGGWFLDWADPMLDDEDRAHLGRVASRALDAFVPALTVGVVDGGFTDAVEQRVIRPLAVRGITACNAVQGKIRRPNQVGG